MSQKKKSIAQSLHDTQVAIDNSLNNPSILAAVSEFGYTAGKLSTGRSLYEAAVQAVHRQKSAAGDQQIATANLQIAWKAASAAYQDLAKVARAVYVNAPAELVALGLNRAMPRATGPFIVAGHKLFKNAALQAELAEYGYTAERLTNEAAKITAYEQANLLQESAKGDAQQATQVQRDALRELDIWIAQYLKIARVALRGNPQALEKIGIIVRSSKTAAQRGAAAKAAATRAANRLPAAEPEPDLV